MYKFHKVSDEQILKDLKKLHFWESLIHHYDDLSMPRRATMDSAGYDFFMPFDILLPPGGVITIPTGVKAELATGTFLMIVPRSGLGFKHQLGLANTIGIIDADYIDNQDNEGHIMVKLVNRGETDCSIKKGQAFCQGIIIDYCITDDDLPASYDRTGGIGSTG